MSYRGGMRGGLGLGGLQQASQPPEHAPGLNHPATPTPEAPSRLRRMAQHIVPRPGLGDDMVWEAGKLSRVRWSLSLVGFLVYTFVIITYRLGIGQAAMLVAIGGLLFLPTTLRIPPVVVGVGVMYVWAWVSWVTTAHSAAVYDAIVVLGKLWLILLVAVNVLRTRAEIRLYMIFFLFFYALYPARGTIINYLVGYTHFGRALWNFIYANSNDLAAISLLALSMAAAVLVVERNRLFRIGAFAAVIVLPVIILMTKSRGVFLGLAVFGLFALLPQVRRLRNVAVALLVVGGIALLAPSDVLERVGGLRYVTNTEDLGAVDEERSAEQRYAIWKVSWQIIADNPITGVGFGAYQLAHGAAAPRIDYTRLSWGNRDAHSTYFDLAASIGIPGLLLFLGLVGGVLFQTQAARRRCKTLIPRSAQQLYYLQLGLVGFLIAGIFASYASISFLYLHMALMYVTAQACNDDVARLTRAGSNRRRPAETSTPSPSTV